MSTCERILIVDDEEAVREAVAEALVACGYDILFAAGGREALAVVEKERPDAILLDLLMPDLNGYEVCRILKEDLETQAIPIIILTGFQDSESRDMAMGTGADEFLTKPFSKPELMARVGAVLRTRHLVDHLSELRRESSAPPPPAPASGGSILVVEDDECVREGIGEVLSGTGMKILWAATLEAARANLEECPDVILLDLLLPDGSGLDLLREIKADPALSAASVIVLTAISDVSTKVRGLEMGADDYLVKPMTAVELRARVLNQLQAKRQRDRIVSRFTEITNLALVDPLTGIFNRRYLDDALPNLVKGARRHKHDCCVIMADLDRFKETNDTLGHGGGDEVLKAVAGLLKREIRAMDWVARYGGEEFAVVLPLTDIQTAVLVAGRLRSRMEACPIPVEGREKPWTVTLSLGVAGLGDEALEAQDLLLRADKALFLAKRLGRNQVQVYGA